MGFSSGKVSTEKCDGRFELPLSVGRERRSAWRSERLILLGCARSISTTAWEVQVDGRDGAGRGGRTRGLLLARCWRCGEEHRSEVLLELRQGLEASLAVPTREAEGRVSVIGVDPQTSKPKSPLDASAGGATFADEEPCVLAVDGNGVLVVLLRLGLLLATRVELKSLARLYVDEVKGSLHRLRVHRLDEEVRAADGVFQLDEGSRVAHDPLDLEPLGAEDEASVLLANREGVSEGGESASVKSLWNEGRLLGFWLEGDGANVGHSHFGSVSVSLVEFEFE